MHTHNDAHNLYQLSPSSLPTWGAWFRMTGRMLGVEVTRLTDTFARAQERARQRQLLLSLDDRILRDIGISRSEAWLEGSRPAWRE